MIPPPPGVIGPHGKRERDSEGGERGRHAESLRSDVIFVFYSCVYMFLQRDTHPLPLSIPLPVYNLLVRTFCRYTLSMHVYSIIACVMVVYSGIMFISC